MPRRRRSRRDEEGAESPDAKSKLDIAHVMVDQETRYLEPIGGMIQRKGLYPQDQEAIVTVSQKF